MLSLCRRLIFVYLLSAIGRAGEIQTVLDSPNLPVQAAAGTSLTARFRPVAGVSGARDQNALMHEGSPLSSAGVELTLEGPGEFSWRWRLTGASSYDELAFAGESGAGLPFGDAASVNRKLSGSSAWGRETVTLPAGRVKLKWQHRCSGSLFPVPAAGWLDDFRFAASGQSVSLAEALDESSLSWQTASGVQWRGVKPAENESSDFLIIPVQTAPTSGSMLSVNVPPGWFSIRRRGNPAVFSAPPDAVYFRRPLVSSDWVTDCFYTASGGPLNISSSEQQPDLLLDAAEHSPGTVTVEEALDSPGLTWTLSPAPWSWTPVKLAGCSADGEDALLSTTAGNTVNAYTQVTGPAELRASVLGAVRISLGTRELDSGAASEEWRDKVFYIPPGTSMLGFQSKDGGIDRVQLNPVSALSVEEAVDSAAFTWSWPADSAWVPIRGSGDADWLWCNSGTMATVRNIGAGRVAFQWRKATSFTLNGRTVTTDSSFNTQNWSRVYFELPSGSHALGLGGTGSEYDVFEKLPDQRPWSGALGLETAGISGTGDAHWSVVEGAEFRGGAALASPALKGGQVCTLHLTELPTASLRKVALRWRAGADLVRFAVATATSQQSQCRLTGTNSWKEETFSGPLVITIKPAGPEGCPAGAILIDELNAESNGPLTSLQRRALGVETNAATTALFTIKPAISSSAESHSGTGALKFTNDTAIAANYQLDIPLDYPAEVSFWWRTDDTASTMIISGAGGAPWQYLGGPPRWRQALAHVPSAVAPALHLSGSLPSGRAIFIEGLSVRPLSDTGSFHQAAGAASLGWIIFDTTEDAAFPDTGMLREGMAGARMGTRTDKVICSVSGPGILRGWWRRDLNGGALTAGVISPDTGLKVVQDELRKDGVWQPFLIPVTATGSTAVHFDAVSGVPGSASPAWWLQNVTFEARSLTPGEALGSPELSWVLSPEGVWATPKGSLQLISAAPAGGASATITVSGPGFLRQRLMTPYITDFKIDGTVVPQSDFMPIPPGDHTLRWEVEEGAGPLPLLTAPVRFLPLGTTTVAEALDFSGTGVQISNAPGLVTLTSDTESADAVDLAVSGPVTTTTPRELAAFTVTGPASVRWQLRLAGAGNANFVHALDGAEVSSALTYDGRWKSYALSVPAGVHTLTFSAILPEFASNPAYILFDQLLAMSDTPATSIAGSAMDASGRGWIERSASPLTQELDPAAIGGSRAATTWLGTGEYTWLETSISGPGILFIQTAADLQPPSSSAPSHKIELIRSTGTTTVPYGLYRLYIPESGSQTIRFNFRGSSDSGRRVKFTLDGFAFAPLTGGPSLATALNITQFGISGTWSGLDAGVYGQLAAATSTTTRTLSLHPPSVGMLSWKWAHDFLSAGLELRRSEDNKVLASQFTATVAWKGNSIPILPRYSDVYFTALGSFNGRAGFLDDLQWTPALPVTPEEAMDDTAFSVQTYGMGYAWQAVRLPDNFPWWAGEDVFVTSNAAHESESSLYAAFSGSGILNFDWRVSSEANDRYEFYLDGALKTFISGESGANSNGSYSGWPVAAGYHGVQWVYKKNASLHGGDDTAMLKGAMFTPILSLSISEVLDEPAAAFTSGGSGPAGFVPVPDNSATGGTAAVFHAGPIATPAPKAWLDTTLTGEGQLTLSWRGDCRLLVDGAAQTTANPWYYTALAAAGWTRVHLKLTGATTKQIRIEAVAGNTAPAVDDFHFEPAPDIVMGTNWISGGTPWVVSGNSLTAVYGRQTESWVEGTFTGPGLLTATVSGQGNIQLDGIPAFWIYLFTDNLSLLVPPGPHRMRCQSVGPAPLKLASVHFTSAGNPWLPDLLNASQFWMRTMTPYAYSQGADWPMHPGDPFAWWGNSDAAPVQVFLPGAGKLGLYWSRPPETEANFGAAFYTGIFETCSDANEWVPSFSQRFTASGWAEFGAGDFSYSSTSPIYRAVHVRMDELHFIPLSETTLAAAADTECLSFSNSPGWFGNLDSSLTADGFDSVAAYGAAGAAPGPLRATLNGPASLSWTWKTTAGSSLDVVADGQKMLSITSTAWTRAVLQLAPGPHTIEWKPVSTARDSSFALDQFTCTELTPERDMFGSLIPVAANTVPHGSAWTVIVPGPSVANFEQPSAFVFAHSGLRPVNLPLQNWTLEPLEEVSLAEALGWTGPLTADSVWKGYRCASGDFAWCELLSGSRPASLAVQAQGAGEFSWPGTGGRWTAVVNSGDAIVIPAPGPYSFSIETEATHSIQLTAEAAGQLFVSALRWQPYHADNFFAAWSALHELDAANPSLDSDGDGQSNFYEFAFASDPGLATSRGTMRAILVAVGDSLRPAIEFSGLTAAGLHYELEEQTNAGWVTDTEATLGLTDEGENLLTFRLTSSRPLIPGTTVILRVRVWR